MYSSTTTTGTSNLLGYGINNNWTKPLWPSSYGTILTYSLCTCEKPQPSVTEHWNDTEAVFELEVPGVEAADIKVTYNRGNLEVTATRKAGKWGKEDKKLSFTFNDLEDADVAKIETVLKNGVLTVAVPYKAEQIRVVPVQV